MAAFLVVYVGAQVYTLVHFRKLLRLTPWMIAGLSMFVVSFLLNQSWNISSQSNEQVRIWQIALGLTATLYVLILWRLSWLTDFIRQSGVLILLLLIGVTFAALNTPEGNVLERKAYEAIQVTLIFCACFLCFLQTRTTQDRVPWTILAAAEGYTIPQYFMCQIVHKPGVRVEGAACVDAYGYLAEWAFSAFCGCVLMWFMFRWYRHKFHGIGS